MDKQIEYIIRFVFMRKISNIKISIIYNTQRILYS